MPNLMPSKYRTKIAFYKTRVFFRGIFSHSRAGVNKRARAFSVLAIIVIVGLAVSFSIYGLNLQGRATNGTTKISGTGTPTKVSVYTTGDDYVFNENGFKPLPEIDGGEVVTSLMVKLRTGTTAGPVTYIIVTSGHVYFKHSNSSLASTVWDAKVSFPSGVNKIIGLGGGWSNAYYLGDNRRLYYTTSGEQGITDTTKSISEILIPDFSKVQDFYCFGNNNGYNTVCAVVHKKTNGDLSFVYYDPPSGTIQTKWPDFPAAFFGTSELMSLAGVVLQGGTQYAELHFSDKKVYRSTNGGAWSDYNEVVSYKYGDLVKRSMNVSAEDAESHFYITQNATQTMAIYANNSFEGFFPSCRNYLGAGGITDNINNVASYVFAYDATCDPNNPQLPDSSTNNISNAYNYSYKGISIHTKAENMTAGYEKSATAVKGAGHIVKFTLTVTNSDVAKSVDVKFALPSGFSYVVNTATSAPTDGTGVASPTDGVMKWTGYNAPVGDSTIIFNTLAP